MRFLQQLMAQLRAVAFAHKSSGGKFYAPSRADILRRPELHIASHSAGVRRRLEAHARCCIQGYELKKRLARDGKGNNTTQGIPAQYLA